MKKKTINLLLSLVLAWTGSTAALAIEQDAGGVYQIATAADLDAFRGIVTDGNLTANAVLTADIDMSTIDNFAPIGYQKAYAGTFDGQGHRILNLTMTWTDSWHWGIGLFSRLGGGAVVKNVIIDATCHITGGENVGAITGTAVTGNGGDIIIESCGNEGTVESTSTGTWYWNQRVAAIVGCCSYQGTDYPDRVVISNCYNTGDILAANERVAAICAFANGKVSATNCYNTGHIMNGSTEVAQFIYEPGGSTITNCYSTMAGEGVTAVTAQQIASGELCFLVNGSISESTVAFRQNLTGDVDPHPVLDATHSIVYAVGDLNCDGTAKGTISYNNIGGEGTRDAHNYVNGICSVCTTYEEPTLTDGIYHIGNCGQLVSFGTVVKGNAAVNAVLTADIDLQPIDNFTPLGYGTGYTSTFYAGTFDGQGHRILNLHLDRTSESDWGLGLFSMLAPGAVVKNVILDATCSIRGRNYVGGIAGAAKGVGTVTIENCGNEGTVACTGADGWYWNLRAGGIIGSADGRDGDAMRPTIVISNCYNTGNITGTLRTAAICAGAFGNVQMSGCYNTGHVSDNSAGETGALLYDNMGSVVTGCFNTMADDATRVTDEQTASGELCYLLNGKAEGGTPWMQDIDNGGTQTAHPVPCGEAGAVYAFNGAYTNTESVTLDENTTYEPTEKTAVNATLRYTFQEGWNSLVLPFATTAAALKTVLGATDVKAFTAVTAADGLATLSFADAADIAAATPVMVKMPAEAPATFAFANVNLTADEAQTVSHADGDISYDFKGNYTADLDLTDQDIYVILGTKAIHSAAGKKATAHAFRAYFVNESAQGGSAKFSILDGDETGIESEGLKVNSEKLAPVYNLQGQRVADNYRGITIVNGKKVMRNE